MTHHRIYYHARSSADDQSQDSEYVFCSQEARSMGKYVFLTECTTCGYLLPWNWNVGILHR